MMEENTTKSPPKAKKEEEIQPVEEEETNVTEQPLIPPTTTAPVTGGSGGWGGWGLSVFTDLQKAAAVAAEEISRNLAVEAAKTAAKSISEMQTIAENSESSKEDETEASSDKEGESEDEEDKRRKAALDKLEKASEDTFLGQRLKVIDNSVENFASGAWSALGNAWKGGSSFVNKLENSAVNLAESIQQGGLPTAGSVAPSLIESGKAFTARGMQVLENVGKETLDLLITETGMEVDKNDEEGGQQTDEEQPFEEVTFDRCFYIYGGPEQLEELEALSSHYTLLFNRRKAKLSAEQKAVYDGKLKQVQEVFDLSTETDGSSIELEKGKKVETIAEGTIDEIKNFHDSSVSKAAEMAAGFANALAGLGPTDIIQRSAGRLDSLHSEGVHRLSEMCFLAVSQLLILAKSVISNAKKDQDNDEDIVNLDWPEDSVEKAKIIRTKAQSMTGSLEAVSISFITGISDVAEAYAAAIKGATADSDEHIPEKLVQDKANSYSENLGINRTTALGKLQDGLQYLSYVVLSTSIPSA